MRHLLQTMLNALLSADADAVMVAEWGQPSPTRTTHRNGYRHRDLDTRVGTLDMGVPKLHSGTYFPRLAHGTTQTSRVRTHHHRRCLLPRRRCPRPAWLPAARDAGIATGGTPKLVKTLGTNALSKSQVSRMAADLDQLHDDFRHCPLDDAGPFTFVTADALTMNAREGRRVINTVVSLATGVNNDGHRGVLGLRVATSETGSAWNEFFADLVVRGLSGVLLVTRDAHAGLRKALSANLPGASWQPCRTHDAANSSGSSPTTTRSCTSSAPSCPNKPVNGPKDAATSASTSSPAHARPSSPTRPPSQDTNPCPHSPPEPTPRRNTPLHHCQRLDRRRAQGDARERERVAAIPALSQDPLREFDRASQLSTRFADGHLIGERGTEIANVDENRRYARARCGAPGRLCRPRHCHHRTLP
ncbi:transposase [Dermacoccus sp. GAS27A]